MDSESNYKNSLLILPRYPRDSETFMRCGFLKLIRLSAEVKHSYNFLFLIPPVLCWQGKEAEGHSFMSRKAAWLQEKGAPRCHHTLYWSYPQAVWKANIVGLKESLVLISLTSYFIKIELFQSEKCIFHLFNCRFEAFTGWRGSLCPESSAPVGPSLCANTLSSQGLL